MLLKIHIFSSILINLTQLLTIATKLRVISIYLSIFMGGSDVKESAAVQKTQVQFLGLEDPLENIYKIKYMFSSLTLCDPMYCSPPGSSVHGIL